MRPIRLTLAVLFAVVRFALAVKLAVVRAVTVCLLWLVAPRACLAFTLLQRR